MTDAMKEKSGTAWCVIQIGGEEPLLVSFHESEGDARAKAEKLAREHDGYTFLVFQKFGTAELEHRVKWEGAKA